MKRLQLRTPAWITGFSYSFSLPSVGDNVRFMTVVHSSIITGTEPQYLQISR
ncbi:hypothetical protein [Prevotella jejuni]|uniref:hypothetical protein n=1 Tax=Prevotella jejuni TaxID=1177574 RepID=UPI0028E264A8|nr:hypothetical protein [Prevotella jejuni]